MELLALGKPIKKPPRSDERDGELFCGTPDIKEIVCIVTVNSQAGMSIISNPTFYGTGAYNITGGTYFNCTNTAIVCKKACSAISLINNGSTWDMVVRDYAVGDSIPFNWRSRYGINNLVIVL